MCLGVHNEILYLSIRTKPLGRDAGLLVQKVIVAPGKAGGHGTMAGGQVSLAGREAGPLVAETIRRFLRVMGETEEGEDLC